MTESPSEPESTSGAVAKRLIARADQAYLARDWATALSLYHYLRQTHPTLSGAFAFDLTIAHCAIELTEPNVAPSPALEGRPILDSPRAAQLVPLIRARVHEACRNGDHRRASDLLRLIAPWDPAIGGAYAGGLLTRRSSAGNVLRARPAAAPPGFITDQAVGRWPIAAAQQQHRGKRLLLVRRFGFVDNPARRHEVGDNLARSATSFGLTVRQLDSQAPPGAAFAAALQHEIDSFAPDVIVYDELFLSGVSAQPEQADAIARLLEQARRQRGLRVVKSYTDAWYVVAHQPENLFKHLGRCFDIVHHCHPGMLDRGTDAERAAVFCYPFPTLWPAPTAEPDSVPRAGFVGGIHPGSVARLVWWAECARADLPLDFIEARHDAVAQRSDLDYVNLLRAYRLSVNFTLRPTGARILTARTLEVPLAGGVLVEEDSADARYFMTPASIMCHSKPCPIWSRRWRRCCPMRRAAANSPPRAMTGSPPISRATVSGPRCWVGSTADRAHRPRKIITSVK
ncbi:MAG: hypothetical protein WDO24_07735 [Pseudomonadota bacterium]